MQVETRRQCLADFQPAHAVAMAVEAWRERAEPDLRRKCCDYATADAALGGNADAIDPFAGIIIHAGTGHHGQRASHDVRRDHLNASHRIDAAIGKRPGQHGEGARGDRGSEMSKSWTEYAVGVVPHDKVNV